MTNTRPTHALMCFVFFFSPGTSVGSRKCVICLVSAETTLPTEASRHEGKMSGICDTYCMLSKIADGRDSLESSAWCGCLPLDVKFSDPRNPSQLIELDNLVTWKLAHHDMKITQQTENLHVKKHYFVIKALFCCGCVNLGDSSKDDLAREWPFSEAQHFAHNALVQIWHNFQVMTQKLDRWIRAYNITKRAVLIISTRCMLYTEIMSELSYETILFSVKW